MTRAVNRLRRLQLALRHLAEVGGTSRRLDVWDAVRGAIPLEDEELAPNSKGKPVGNSDFFWGSASMAIAGFLEKSGHGIWRVTELGREASAPEVGHRGE